MTTLVVGATGAPGRLLVEQLLERGRKVRALVRTPSTLPESIRTHPNLSVIHAIVLELSHADLAEHVHGCTAVASCLGHSLSLKGIYGSPRRLVANATRRLCTAVKANAPEGPTRFVLMNTAGNRNRDLDEQVSFTENAIVGLIRLLLPPHRDNEMAADYLRFRIGQHDKGIEWAAVRPDNLIDEDQVTEYDVYPPPIRSAIFNAGRTSRINVAHFMAELITDDEIWDRWKGQMPVIYNRP